jgi:hypothetical protein
MFLAVATLIAAGVLGLLALCLRSGARMRSALLAAAARYEAEGRFEDACYHYGIAAWRGAGELGSSRVRELWRVHGPFSFAQAGEEMRDRYCSASESCGEGFHQITLREIARIVSESGITPPPPAARQ